MGKRLSGRLIPVRLDEANYERLVGLARAYGLRPAVMARLLLIQALHRSDRWFETPADGPPPAAEVVGVSEAPTRYYILSEDDLAAIRRLWEESALRVSQAMRQRARQMPPGPARAES